MKTVLWVVLAISVAPFLLNLLGLDLQSPKEPFPYDQVQEMSPDALANAHFHTLHGAFTHTILEWSALCAAVFTVILAFTHFNIKRDAATPIVGVALFMAGCMDGFHTLAADRLITATTPNADLIPFTWAICRAFYLFIMILGISLFFSQRKKKSADIRFVIFTSVVLGIVAWKIIHFCATQATLPQTMFPDAIITRPWDMVALVLFIIVGAVVYPPFHKQQQSYFSAAVWISVIPNIATQMHMAFGSTALFDSHFHIAHFLKVIAYLTPCTGLILGYVHFHREEVDAKREAEKTRQRAQQAELKARIHANELLLANNELDQFAYVASHDLKAPLRAIRNLVGWILEDIPKEAIIGDVKKNADRLSNRVRRMESLINDLLQYSRAGRQAHTPEQVNMDNLLRNIIDLLDPPNGFVVEVAPNMPTFSTVKTPLMHVFTNLISNALKHHHQPQEGRIKISCRETGSFYEFMVADNGPGIPINLHKKAFQIFQTLRPQDEVEGTGVGLALIDKLIKNQGGTILLESDEGKGAAFRFTWPRNAS